MGSLTGLHLRRRPVDRVDLGPGANTAEEVVGWSPVGLEEPVPLGVADDLLVPFERLVAAEVAAHDQAAAPPQRGEVPGSDGAGLDVGVVDDRPGGGPGRLVGGDLLQARPHPGFHHPEYLAHGPSRCLDPGAQGALDLADGGGQVVRHGFPVRQFRPAAAGAPDGARVMTVPLIRTPYWIVIL